MLFIKSLTLTNFGRHKKMTADINGHVAGLTGPNGLGKSTVLQGLQLAYSGTIDHPDPLRSFIRRSSGPNPPKHAEVESLFEADGREGRIIRRITRTTVTHKLWWDGAEKPITKAAEIARIMFDILGVDKKAINSTVFIRQGEMASMFGLETDRRDFYTRLLMLGHLEKISRQVDVHREHQAATVKDLGAVKDQAEGTAAEAAERFQAADEALQAAPSQAESLVTARGILGAFEDYDNAEEAGSRATEALKHVVDTGLDPDQFVERTKGELSKARSEVEQMTTRKGAHMDATTTFRKAKDHLQTIEDTAKAFLDVHEIEAALVDLGELAEDPALKIKACEEMLTKFDAFAQLESDIPAWGTALAELRERKENLDEIITALEKEHEATKEVGTLARSNVSLRQEMLKSLKGHEGDHKECPLCYSNTPPNAERLREDIDREESLLKSTQAKYREQQTALGAKKDTRDDVVARLKALELEEKSGLQAHKRLRIELSLTTRGAVESELADLKKEAQAFAAKSHEHNRLVAELRTRKTKVEGLKMPTQNDDDAAQAALDAARKELEKSPWSEGDDEAYNKAFASAKSLQEQIDKVQKQVADYASAQERLAKTKKDLEEKTAAAADDFFAEVQATPGTALTLAEVSAKIELLEARQREHDEARGRKETANEALRSANRKVTELETRIAEQKHRLDLVQDLTDLRDAFKPTGASLEYLNYKFGQIAELAGDYLAESGADFMVAPSEDLPLSFDFLRTDRENEVWMGQSRMSGGQKVRLAVATLRAIHAMVMPNVGLLVLDEPTTHLDEEAKRSMAEMLQKIGEEGTLQMIVCDHSPTLIDAFSDIIEIPS